MTLSKDVKDLIAKAEKKFYDVKKPDDDSALVTNHEGEVFEFGRTNGGMNKIQKQVPEGQQQTREEALRNKVSFGDGLLGHKGENVLADIARIGLELRDRPKKDKAARAAAQAESIEQDPEPPTTPEAPMSEAVQEILSSLTTVEGLLHEAVLQAAREQNCPVQWLNSKKYLDYTGHALLTEFLKDLYEDLDTSDAALAPLERKLPRYLARGGYLERIHLLGVDDKAVWRVRDDGRVFKDAMPTVPPAPPEPRTAEPAFVEPAIVPTAAEPSHDPETEAVMSTLYKCDRPKCGFADHSAQALVMHNTQLRDNANDVHPETTYACPLCAAARNDAGSLQAHLRRRHGTGHLCYSCTAAGKPLWFTDADDYNKHLEDKHADERRRRISRPAAGKEKAEDASRFPSKPLSASEPAVEANVPEAVMEPSTALSGLVVSGMNSLATQQASEAALQAATMMVTAYPTLVAANQRLAVEKEQLEVANRALTEEVERLRGKTEAADDLEVELKKERGLREAAERQITVIRDAQKALKLALGD